MCTLNKIPYYILLYIYIYIYIYICILWMLEQVLCLYYNGTHLVISKYQQLVTSWLYSI